MSHLNRSLLLFDTTLKLYISVKYKHCTTDEMRVRLRQYRQCGGGGVAGVGPSPGQWSVWQMPGVTAEVTTTTHPNTPQE